MEVKAGFHPESEEALSMIQEEAKTNDLTRFERFNLRNGLRKTSQVCHDDCYSWTKRSEERCKRCRGIWKGAP